MNSSHQCIEYHVRELPLDLFKPRALGVIVVSRIFTLLGIRPHTLHGIVVGLHVEQWTVWFSNNSPPK